MARPFPDRRAARTGRSVAAALGLAALTATAPVLVPVASAPAYARGAPDSFADLAERVSEAVVNISATQNVDSPRRSSGPGPNAQPGPGTPFDDLFEEFFRRRRQQGQGGQGGPGGRDSDDDTPRAPRRANSLGSGFVIDPSGIVITNSHVIADANEVQVIFTDGTKLKAEIIGKDPKVDVAVLRVKPDKPLKAVKFADSDKARVGEWVLAVGNPFGLGGSVTAGIISARNRNIESGPYDDFIQTDASINKGNSGGPVFNLDGDVLGIATAILSPSGGSVGIGFATPANTVVPIIDQLQKYGETRRGWLGVRIQNVDDAIAESLGLGKVRGALVAGIDEKGPAKSAGFKTGDVIVRFDGKEVKRSRDLPRLVAQAPVGKDVEVTVMRDGKELPLSVHLGRLEDGEKQASLNTKSDARPEPSAVQAALGMKFAALSDETRQRFNIKESVKNGVVVTDVDVASNAAEKRVQKGDVIVEINQEPVKTPGDVARRVKALKESGKKSALLLVANAQGEVRFVPVQIE